VDNDVTRRVLVAGIGNIFLGDDGFGVEVAARLAGRKLPEGVRAADFGIRGIHLAYELLDGYDALVLIDAMPLGEPPGTLAVVEPDELRPHPNDEVSTVFDAHTMSPGVVLGILEMLDAQVKRIVIVGCQPQAFEGIGLSPPVEEAVEVAVDLLEDVLNDICLPAEPAVSEAPG
jgi:hydrogenase maturation protease